MRWLRRNAVALVALSVALGGTSYAASKVTGRQVKNESLTGRDIRDGSIRQRDLASGVIAEPTPVPTAVPSKFTVRTGPWGTSTDVEVSNEVRCAPGERVTGGGGDTIKQHPVQDLPDFPPSVLIKSAPMGAAGPNTTFESVGWRVTVRYTKDTQNQEVPLPLVYAVCAS